MNSDKISVSWKDKTFELRRGTIILLDKPNTEILGSGFEGRGMVMENCMFGGLVLDVYPSIHTTLTYFIGIEKGKAVIENLTSFGVTIVYNDGDKWLITPDMIRDVFLRKPVPLIDQHGELIRRLEPTKQLTAKLNTSTISKFLPVVGSNERLVSFSSWPTVALRSFCSSSGMLDPAADKALSRKFFPDPEDVIAIQKVRSIRKAAENRAVKNKGNKKVGYSSRSQYYGGYVSSSTLQGYVSSTLAGRISSEPSDEQAEPPEQERGLHKLPFIPSGHGFVEDTPNGAMFRHQIGHVAEFDAVNLSGDIYFFPISEFECSISLTKNYDKDVFNLIMKPGTIICLNEKPDTMVVENSILNGNYPNVANSLTTLKINGPNESYYELMAISLFRLIELDPEPAYRFRTEVDQYVSIKFPLQYQSAINAINEIESRERQSSGTASRARRSDIFNAIGRSPLVVTEACVSYPHDGEIVINADDCYASTVLNAVEDGSVVKIMNNSSSGYSGVLAEYIAVSGQFLEEYELPSVLIKFRRNDSPVCSSKFVGATARNKEYLAEYFYRNQGRIPSGIFRAMRRAAEPSARTSFYTPRPRAETEALHIYTGSVKVNERDAILIFDYDQLGATLSKSIVRNNSIIEITDNNRNILSRWQITNHGYFLWGVQFESRRGQLMPGELAGKMAQRLEIIEENPQEVAAPSPAASSTEPRRSLSVLQDLINVRPNSRDIYLNCDNLHQYNLDKLAYYGTMIRVVDNGDRVLRRYVVVQPRFAAWRIHLRSSDPDYSVPPDLREIYVEERSVERPDVPIRLQIDNDAYASTYINGRWEENAINIQNVPAPTAFTVDTASIFTEQNAEAFWRQTPAINVSGESMETGEMIISTTLGAVDYKIIPDHFKITTYGDHHEVVGHLNVEYKLSSGIGAVINARITWSPTKGWYYMETAPGMLVKDNNRQLNDFLNDLFHIDNVTVPPAELIREEYTGEEE